jgi:hypothetical protein
MGLRQPKISPGYFLLAIGLILIFIPAVLAASDKIPRISIQDLKAKMDTSEQMVILDVRSGEDYASSMYKIKGAVRIPLDQIKDRYRELPAGMEIITYCA